MVQSFQRWKGVSNVSVSDHSADYGEIQPEPDACAAIWVWPIYRTHYRTALNRTPFYFFRDI